MDDSAFVNSSSGQEVSKAYASLFSDGKLLCNDDTNKPLLLASEQIVHLVDGWKYLAAATSSLLNNSESHAIHLAYYAQLRGALSLFSGSGMRIMKGDSFYIDSQGNSNKENAKSYDGTHVAVSSLWEFWIKTGIAQDLIGSVKIQPEFSFNDLKASIQLIQPNKSLSSLGYDFFKLTTDRLERNKNSYQADLSIKEFHELEFDLVEFIKHLNRLLLPSSIGLYFDRYLVSYFFDLSSTELFEVEISLKVDKLKTETQASIDELRDGGWNNEAQELKVQLNKSVKEIEESSDSERSKDEFVSKWIKIIADDNGLSFDTLKAQLSNSETDVFKYASEEKSDLKNILSRSVFMLRLATLSVQENIHQYGNESIKEWFKKLLENVGNWQPDSGVELEDLSVDFMDAMDELEIEEDDPLPYSLWSDHNIKFSYRMSRQDMILAWSLGLEH